jgi:hypothetical protein
MTNFVKIYTNGLYMDKKSEKKPRLFINEQSLSGNEQLLGLIFNVY